MLRITLQADFLHLSKGSFETEHGISKTEQALWDAVSVCVYVWRANHTMAGFWFVGLTRMNMAAASHPCIGQRFIQS